MKAKRYITGLVGFPIVVVVLSLSNKYVIDVIFALVAALSLYEYFHALKLQTRPVQWLGYAACTLIALIHVVPVEYFVSIIGIALLATLLIAGVPVGGGTISETLIITMLGYPLAALPLLTVVATIIDAPATMLNVVGDMASSMMVTRIVDGKDWDKEK